MLKKISLGLLAILVLIQFIKPAANVSAGPQANAIGNKYPMNDVVKNALAVACNDCHSNNTKYPWYSSIQPVSWFLANHVNDGKRHLNFDEFLVYEPKKMDHKLEELIESQEEGWMPISSYTLIHKDAILNADQKKAIIDYAKEVKAAVGYVPTAEDLAKEKQRKEGME